MQRRVALIVRGVRVDVGFEQPIRCRPPGSGPWSCGGVPGRDVPQSVIWLISGLPVTSAPPESPVNTFPKIPPSSLTRNRTPPRVPGPLLPRRPRRLSTVEKTRPSRFLGDPCVHAPLFDPGGPPAPGQYRAGDVVFRTLNNVDSAFAPFEARSRGLRALCVRFAAGVAPGPRNTRFRLVASLTGQDSHLLGRIDGLPSCLSVYMASSITKLRLAQSHTG